MRRTSKRLFFIVLSVGVRITDAQMYDRNDVQPTGDQPVLVFFDHGPRLDNPKPSPPAGAVVPYSAARDILYLRVPCQLPLVHKTDMLRFADTIGVGCWYPTLGGGAVKIYSDGRTQPVTPFATHTYELATFHISEMTFKVIKEDGADALATQIR
jgi:hypothetical protein